MINLITRISVVGIAVITAALVVLLSAFNGIEFMIDKLYSDFDTDLTVRPVAGKTFNENRIDLDGLKGVEGIAVYSRAIEEVVILKHEKKWANASLYAVDSTFLKMANVSSHMVDGDPVIEDDKGGKALIGATLLDKLDGYIPRIAEDETIICFVPKKKIKIRPGKSPFNHELLRLSGRLNYNREVNDQAIVVPLEMARDLLSYTDKVSAIYVDCLPREDKEVVKERLQKFVGNGFVVKTRFEKNALIYKTSKSEKIIVVIILMFIFILAAFNLVASLTMLFVEKQKNLWTMISFGATHKFIFKIFFFEGLLIAGKGIFFGGIVGYAICLSQINFGLVTMPNSAGEAFPMALSLSDGVLIFSLVSLLSFIFSYLPVKYLIKKNLT